MNKSKLVKHFLSIRILQNFEKDVKEMKTALNATWLSVVLELKRILEHMEDYPWVLWAFNGRKHCDWRQLIYSLTYETQVKLMRTIGSASNQRKIENTAFLIPIDDCLEENVLREFLKGLSKQDEWVNYCFVFGWFDRKHSDCWIRI